MDKRHLHHIWTRLRAFKPWYFLIIAAVSGVVAVFALRHNNLRMLHFKEAVYVADKNNGDTQKALQNLQVYVVSHMNTDLSTGSTSVYPPVQLKYTYDRLVQAESDALATTNSQLYNDAQKYCESQNSTDFSGRNRVPCIQQYVKDHGQPLRTIPDSLYKFDFVSPMWSPDLAGWSLLVSILFSLAAIIMAGLHWWVRQRSR